MNRRKLILAIAAALLATTLAGCGPAKQDHAWQQVQQTGTLRVGMDASYPPFESVNEATGEIVGFDVDLANEIGRRLGFTITFENIPYDGLYDSLTAGRVDMLLSALVAAPEEGKAHFSVPYFNAGDQLVLPTGSALRSMDDLAGRTVAVEYGSGGDVEARAWQRRLSALEVVRYPDPDSALAAVIDGEADAALVDGIAAKLGVGQHPELKLGDYADETLFAAAFHPDSRELLGTVDPVMRAMLSDGTVGTLIEKWFGPQR
jgi:ABC-type amino acid transport substrate-binding protein